MSDKQNDQIIGNEILILVPLLCTTAAVCWETGKLLPFGGFQYFSLTDHALATLDALPAIAFLISFAAVFFWIANQLVVRLSRRISKLATFIALALFFFGLRVTGSLFVFRTYRLADEPTGATILMIGLFLWTANSVWWRYPLTRGAGLVVTLMLTAVFTVKIANILAELWLRRPQNHLSNVYLDSGQQIDGVVVMAGERGILVYEPTRNRMLYLKAETIQRVEWPRHNPVLPSADD